MFGASLSDGGPPKGADAILLRPSLQALTAALQVIMLSKRRRSGRELSRIRAACRCPPCSQAFMAALNRTAPG
eukprot:15468659-Alexandrium_andersonii.AAC.1